MRLKALRRPGYQVTESHHPVLPVKVADNSDNNTGWTGMPFLNLYRSYNKSSSESDTSKLEPLNDYNPVYVSSFYELECQGVSRLSVIYPEDCGGLSGIRW
ncbi:hypothetical protein C5167_011878 [Papaver somniferum]|uniref:Uncharacterized protein n=1 Tax=Papaver somniferum TaxID=3469 RepID=A0A4Y7IZ93_PAPSO|nr:hypothetical protein C5167_011878 [Papaver somniferum]